MTAEVLKKLDDERSALEKKLVTEQEARDGFALEAAGGNKEAARGVEQAEAEIARLKNMLDRNAGAQRAAKAQASAAGQKRKREDTKAAADQARKLGKERVKLGKEIDDLEDARRDKLLQWKAMGLDLRTALRAVVDGADLNSRKRDHQIEVIHSIVSAAGASALEHTHRETVIMFDRGHLVDLTDPGISFSDGASMAFDRLALKLDELQREKK